LRIQISSRSEVALENQGSIGAFLFRLNLPGKLHKRRLWDPFANPSNLRVENHEVAEIQALMATGSAYARCF
jgi:hypothetical protein